MATIFDYKFDNMSRIGNDPCDISQRNLQNVKNGNYTTSNFFVNERNATSQDIEELINRVKKQVFEKTNTNLELEIKIIGKNK